MIEWLRLPGDVMFIAGLFPLVWMTAQGRPPAAARQAPRDETAAAVEAPLFIEVTPGGEPSSAATRARGSMTP